MASQSSYNIAVDYTYYYEKGDIELPDSGELEVTEFYINSESVSLDFYYEFIHPKIEEDVLENAYNNL